MIYALIAGAVMLYFGSAAYVVARHHFSHPQTIDRIDRRGTRAFDAQKLRDLQYRDMMARTGQRS